MVVCQGRIVRAKRHDRHPKIKNRKGRKMKKAFKILIPLFVFALIVGCLFAFGASADATTGAESTDECWGVYDAEGTERGKANSLKSALELAENGDTVKPLFDNITTDTVDTAELKDGKTVTLALKNNKITATGAEVLFKINAGSKLIINAENSSIDLAANKGLARLDENSADLKAGLEINGLDITTSAGGARIIWIYGGDIRIDNTHVLAENNIFLNLFNESVVNVSMTNSTVTERAATAGIYIFSCGQGGGEKFAAGSTLNFTGCTFTSAYRIFAIIGADGQVPLTFDNCVLESAADVGIRAVGMKIEVKGESVVKAKTFVWCASGTASTVIIGDGVRSSTKTFYNDNFDKDNSSPLTGFGASLKYADRDTPYVYGGEAADDGSVLPGQGVLNNLTTKGGEIIVSSERKDVPNIVDGTKMRELMINSGKFGSNPFFDMQNCGIIKVNDGDSFYLTLEFDVSTYDTIPERTQIYVLGRSGADGWSGEWLNNAVVRMNNAGEGKFSVGLYVAEKLVGKLAIIDAGDWAHVTYVVHVTTEVAEGVNQSEGVVYVNGEFLGSSKAIFNTKADLRSINSTRLEVASNIQRNTASSLLLANARMLKLNSSGDFEETIFSEGHTFASEYLAPASVRPARIPVAQVGDAFYNTVEEALANANGGVVKLLKNVTNRLVINEPVTIDKNGYTCDLYDSDVCRIITDDENGTIQFVTVTDATKVTYEIYGDPDAENDPLVTFTRPVGTLARIAEHLPLVANIFTADDGKTMILAGWTRSDNGTISDTTRATLDEAENGVMITPVYAELTGAEGAAGVKVNANGTTEIIADDAAFITAISHATPSATYIMLKDINGATATKDWDIIINAELHLDLAGHALIFTGDTLKKAIRVATTTYLYSSLPGGKVISHYPVKEEDFHKAGDSDVLFTLYNNSGAKLYLGTPDAYHLEDENNYNGNLSIYSAAAVSINEDSGVTGFAVYANGVNFIRNGYNHSGVFQTYGKPVSEIHIANSYIIATSDIVGGAKPQVFAFSKDAKMTVTLKNTLIASGGNIILTDESSRNNTASTITFEDCRIVGSLASTDETMRVILKGKNLLSAAPAENVEFDGVCGAAAGVEDADKSLSLTLYYNTYSEWTETVDFNQPEQLKTFEFTHVTGHAFGNWTTTNPATCTTDGEEERECTVCHEKETRAIKATGHSWGEWEETEAPTCSAVGTSTRECSACHAKETKDIDKLPHTPGDWTVKTPATCTAKGIEHKECTVCHEELETRDIEKLPHTPGEWTVKTPATCTEDGVEHKECEVCHDELETRAISATGHDMGDWVVTKEATCTALGEKTRSCKNAGCTHTETEEIPMIAHTESEWIVDKKATATDTGSKHTECTVCHTTIKEESIAKITATIDDESKEWSKKSETLPTIKFNDSVSDITEVKVNGEKVDPKNYTVKNGELTFTKEYLETLKAGEYTVEALSATGNANASFTVKSSTNVALIVVLIVVGVIIVGGAVAFVIIKKKKA